MVKGGAGRSDREAQLLPSCETSFRRQGHQQGCSGYARFSGSLSVAVGVMPIQLALGLTTVIMAVSHIIPLREFYEGVDWPVVVLLGAMIPLGGALESTGTTELLVAGLLVLVGELSPALILAAILILTMTISDVLNNAATAILMAPIAFNIANGLDYSPDAFLMAVAVGASCAFLTPVGHQNNALIMGRGYRFGDYWRMGLPLELLIVMSLFLFCCWLAAVKAVFVFGCRCSCLSQLFRLAYSAISVATVVRFMRVNWKTYNPGPFFDEIISSPVTRANLRKSSPAIFVR